MPPRSSSSSSAAAPRLARARRPRPAAGRARAVAKPHAGKAPPTTIAQVRAAAREQATSVYRDAILAAAEAEFAERGYAATKMLDVARRAGMSVGALYRHFQSKEAIFESLVRRSTDRVVVEMGAVAGGTADPRRRLERMIESMLRFIEEHRGMFRVLHQLAEADHGRCRDLADQSDSARTRLLALYRATLADGVASGALRDDVDLDDQLAFLMGAMHGFLEVWIRSDGEGGLVEKAPLIAGLTLRALGGSS